SELETPCSPHFRVRPAFPPRAGLRLLGLGQGVQGTEKIIHWAVPSLSRGHGPTQNETGIGQEQRSFVPGGPRLNVEGLGQRLSERGPEGPGEGWVPRLILPGPSEAPARRGVPCPSRSAPTTGDRVRAMSLIASAAQLGRLTGILFIVLFFG